MLGEDLPHARVHGRHGAKLARAHLGGDRLELELGPADPLLAGIPDGAYVYFTHSYHALPADPAVVALHAVHGVRITAAIRSGNLFACQFHPEKSQAVGLRLLENFVQAR